jgi:deoxyribose-phosphate aldolase
MFYSFKLLLIQAKDCLLAVELIDLTTLGGDDSESNVERLYLQALNPLRHRTHSDQTKRTVAAICVYPNFLNVIQRVRARLSEDEIGAVAIAVVSTGFPTGQCSELMLRCKEIEMAIERGAQEIDVVILRSLVIQGAFSIASRSLHQGCTDFFVTNFEF